MPTEYLGARIMAGHTHGPTSGSKFWVSLGATLLFTGGEAVAGYLSHSLALFSDAGHNLSDGLALALAAFAIWIAKRPASSRHTYGYHRVAILTAQFNSAALIAIAAAIGIGAYMRFIHPVHVHGTLVIIVAAIAVILNTTIAVALSSEAKNSINARAAFVHMAGDALTGIGVVIAGLIIRTTGWVYVDPIVSAVIAVVILLSALGIVRDANRILMESVPKGLDVDQLVVTIKSVAPVCEVHDLHIWTVGDGLNFLSCHVTVPPSCTLAESSAIIEQINMCLHDQFGIGHATIQAEPVGQCPADDRTDLYCSLEAHAH